MVYNHYMKIKLTSVLFAALWLICASAPAKALTVVKIDGKKVYIDTTPLSRAVQKGDTFKIIISQEKLTNPNTGADLGFVYTYSPEGTIVETQPAYAVGELKEKGNYKVGQEAVLEMASQPAVSAGTADVARALETPKSTRKTADYMVDDQQILSITEADVLGDKTNQYITLSDKGVVTVFKKQGQELVALHRYETGLNKKPVTVSAADVKNSGKAQIFVTVYEGNSPALNTQVVELEKGALTRTDTLPYFTKELGCGKDKTIYSQRPFTSGLKPGDARKLNYADGKFKQDKDGFKTLKNFLTGVNRYDVQRPGSGNFIYTASDGAVKIALANGGYAQSKDVFAHAPNRVKYKQNTLTFYPSVQAYGPNGNATLAAIENIAKKGLLTEQFGLYKSSNLHFLNYQKGELAITDTVELPGFAYDTACTDQAVVVPQIMPGGNTRITEVYR